MRIHPMLRRFVLTVIFMAVMIGSFVLVTRRNRQAKNYQTKELYHILSAKALAKHIGGCRARAEADEKAARVLRAKKPRSRDEESRAKGLLANAEWWRANAKAAEAQLAYHTSLITKYDHAARHPLQTVPPDPPAPPHWDGQALPLADSDMLADEEPLDEDLAELRQMVLDRAAELRELKKQKDLPVSSAE